MRESCISFSPFPALLRFHTVFFFTFNRSLTHFTRSQVPPRDVQRLAAAQVDVFGMLNGLEGLITSVKVKKVTREELLSVQHGGSLKKLESRIAKQKSNRRLLGMRFREYVLSNFTMSRYLREHYCTLLTAESIYHSRKGTGMTEKLISELIQERKLNMKIGSNMLMSQDASRLVRDAISEVERGSVRQMMTNHEAMSEAEDEKRCLKRHEVAVKQFREAIDSARKQADKIEEARHEMLKSLETLMVMKKKKKSSFQDTESKSSQKKGTIETVEKKDERITGKSLLRRVSVYAMSGDISKDSLQERQVAMFRIQSKEDEMIKDMRILRERFAEPLQRGDSIFIRAMLKGKHGVVSDLFNTAKLIETKSCTFRDSLLAITQRADLKTLTSVSSAVAQCVLDHAPNLAIFAKYITQCSNAIDHIDSCTSRYPDLQKFLRLENSNEFMRFLVSPVVRLSAYRDEVEEMLFHTSTYHDDFDAWKLVKEAIRINMARVDSNELENVKSKYHLRRLFVLFSTKTCPASFLNGLKEREYELDKRVIVKSFSDDKTLIHRLVVFKDSVLLVRVNETLQRWNIVMEILDFRIDFDSSKMKIFDNSGNCEITILSTVDDSIPNIFQDTMISELSELASFLYDALSDRVVSISSSSPRYDERLESNDFDDVTFESASDEEKEEDV